MATAYTTAPPEAAAEIASAVVEEELAACVNRFECRSTFRWDGEVVEEEEFALVAKTTDERYDALEARIEELHPYDVPCVARFDETDALEAFSDWIGESVR